MKLIKRDNVTPLYPSMEAREHKYLKHLASAMSTLRTPMAPSLFASSAPATRRIIGMPSKPGSPTTATKFSRSAWRVAVRWTI